MENMADEISRLKSELEERSNALVNLRSDWLEALAEANHYWDEVKRLRTECERLRAACKRNPSSGSCIEALAGTKTKP